MNCPAVEVLLGDWSEHELIDCGNRRKLERFGPCRLVRPEPKAWWQPALPATEWDAADAVFDDQGRWRARSGTPREWVMRFGKLAFQARLTDGSKHVGIFPEQAPHWKWVQTRARGGAAPALLNLFGYTGAVSLVAAAAGFEVTHVDASRPAIAWARRNQGFCGLDAAPIRWLVEDAVRYARREARRGRRYDVVLLDPPSFGRGPAGQVWKVEEGLAELLSLCRGLLAPRPIGIIMTLYNLEASSLMAANMLAEAVRGLDGRVSAGELALPAGSGGRVLPLSLYARWESAAGAE